MLQRHVEVELGGSDPRGDYKSDFYSIFTEFFSPLLQAPLPLSLLLPIQVYFEGVLRILVRP